MGSWGDRALEWLSRAVDMVNIASTRPKDDPLIIVLSVAEGNGVMVGFVDCFEWVYNLVGGTVADRGSSGRVSFVGGDFTS